MRSDELRIVAVVAFGLWAAGTHGVQAEHGGVGDEPPHASAAVFPLLEQLSEEDPEARISAAMALRELGPVAWPAVPALIDALADPVMGVRKSAAGAIGGIGEGAAEAVPALDRALDDPHRFVRSWAAMALFEIGPASRTAAPSLARLLAEDDENLRGRSWAASALPEIGAEAELAVPALVRALREDPAPEVRAVTVLSLEKYGAEAAAGGATLAIVEAMVDPHWKVRGNAACALPKMGDVEASVGLSRLAVTLVDAAPYVRGCTAQAMGALGQRAETYRGELEALLDDEDPHVRESARRALRRIATPRDQNGARGH